MLSVQTEEQREDQDRQLTAGQVIQSLSLSKISPMIQALKLLLVERQHTEIRCRKGEMLPKC